MPLSSNDSFLSAGTVWDEREAAYTNSRAATAQPTIGEQRPLSGFQVRRRALPPAYELYDPVYVLEARDILLQSGQLPLVVERTQGRGQERLIYYASVEILDILATAEINRRRRLNLSDADAASVTTYLNTIQGCNLVQHVLEETYGDHYREVFGIANDDRHSARAMVLGESTSISSPAGTLTMNDSDREQGSDNDESVLQDRFEQQERDHELAVQVAEEEEVYVQVQQHRRNDHHRIDHGWEERDWEVAREIAEEEELYARVTRLPRSLLENWEEDDQGVLNEQSTEAVWGVEEPPHDSNEQAMTEYVPNEELEEEDNQYEHSDESIDLEPSAAQQAVVDEYWARVHRWQHARRDADRLDEQAEQNGADQLWNESMGQDPTSPVRY